MATTEQITLADVEILGDGHLQVLKHVVTVDEQGEVVSRIDWRTTIAPGDHETARAVLDDAYERVMAEAGDAFTAPPKPPVNLDDVVATKMAAIQAEKCRARDAGFLVDGVMFDSDQSARTSYLELAVRLQSSPALQVPWKASAGVWVDMNADLYAKVDAAGTAHIQAVFSWQAARDAEVAEILAGEGPDTEKADAIQAVGVEYEMPGL